MTPCDNYYRASWGCNSSQLINKLPFREKQTDKQTKLKSNINLKRNFKHKLALVLQVKTKGFEKNLLRWNNQRHKEPLLCQACVHHSPWTTPDQIAHQEMVAPKHLRLERKPDNFTLLCPCYGE